MSIMLRQLEHEVKVVKRIWKSIMIFSEASEDDLIMHALRALSGSVAKDEKLTKENGSIAIVGKNKKFILIEEDKLQPYLDRLELEGGVEESPEGDAEEAEESG